MGLKYSALGIYIFAGGFTLGMKKYFNIIGHCEDGPFGTETAKRNLNVQIWDQPEEWPLKQLTGKVDVIYCNPPCAPWSAAGKSTRHGGDNWRKDDRVDCVRNCFNALEVVKPKIWVWESVCRAFTSGRPFVDELTKKANAMGYAVTYFLTDGALHGLPQYRKRFHMICHKVKLNFETPTCKLVTTGSVLRKVKVKDTSNPLSKSFLKLVKLTPPGRGMRGVFDRLYPDAKKVNGKYKGRPNFLKLRLHPQLPASTMTGGKNHLHPTEHRFITHQEAAALTGFPLDYEFTEGAEFQEIGKTVTPVLGDYLGKTFKEALDNNKKATGNSTVDFRHMCERKQMRANLGLTGDKKRR